jgi:glyoxylase-like metal-dependent hydrolase (beta-lactamase superfamily II)
MVQRPPDGTSSPQRTQPATTTMTSRDLIRYDHGIAAVDTHYIRPGLDAAHVVVRDGRAAIVDTGTTHSVSRLLAGLAALGIAADAVDWILLTHVHLDHAGGAGALLAHLPDARVAVHPRGAPHLADPRRLVAASMAVYGEAEYRRLYGELTPVPAERIAATADGDTLRLGNSTVECLHTPGHALHHQVYVDRDADGVFTGDTFGLSYREFDVGGRPFIVPTTTPSQFDPDQLEASIRRILGLGVTAAYLTHYGRVTGLPALGASVLEQLAALVASARRHATAPDRAARLRADLRDLWLDRLKAHGCRLPAAEVDGVLALDLDLNVQGLEAWLDRAGR